MRLIGSQPIREGTSRDTQQCDRIRDNLQGGKLGTWRRDPDNSAGVQGVGAELIGRRPALTP